MQWKSEVKAEREEEKEERKLDFSFGIQRIHSDPQVTSDLLF